MKQPIYSKYFKINFEIIENIQIFEYCFKNIKNKQLK